MQHAIYFGAVVAVLLAAGQVWLSDTLPDGTAWGPTPAWLVFGPLLMWFVIDAVCLLWLIMLACKTARYRHSVVLITAAGVVGTVFAWNTTVGFLQVV